MDLKLSGKRALITGGSKGIGYAIALAFAREGAQPIIVSHEAETLGPAADAIYKETGIAAQTIVIDLAAAGAPEKLVQETGDIDILVNNAGAIPAGTLGTIDEEKWRQSWELKLFGYVNLTRAYLARMEQRKQGVIANIIGMAGVAARYEYVCGSTANAGLIAFTNAVGAASPNNGVRVFGVNPSPTRTDRIVAINKQIAKTRFGDENRWEELNKDLPFGRLLEPEEVANMVVFGCSPCAAYLTGTVINLDGGQLYASPKA